MALCNCGENAYIRNFVEMCKTKPFAEKKATAPEYYWEREKYLESLFFCGDGGGGLFSFFLSFCCCCS